MLPLNANELFPYVSYCSLVWKLEIFNSQVIMDGFMLKDISQEGGVPGA